MPSTVPASLNATKRTPSLEERLRGSALGAAIGAGLAWERRAKPERFAQVRPEELRNVERHPTCEPFEAPGFKWGHPVTPLIDVGYRAYVVRQGRVTPEDFGPVFRDHPGIAAGVFNFLGLHTVQELLKEGMNPRLSGLHNAPCGLIAAAMPAVGAFHFADPEAAYIDGVELASVVQPRLGADWAALAAVAVAAAYEPKADVGHIIETVLAIAKANNRELFYDLRVALQAHQGVSDADLETWWLTAGSRIPEHRETFWISPNPLAYALPLLSRMANDPVRYFALLTARDPGWLRGHDGFHAVPAVIGGAILGALYGPAVFPESWLAWAGLIAQPWLGMTGVVEARLAREQIIVTNLQQLAEPQADHQPSRLQDKITGALLAGAIGNAMGSPVESRSYVDIAREYPQGITGILQPERLESEDDNQMAMLLVETYLAREGRPVTARHFGHTWKERLNREHFFPLCMGNAYDLICRGEDPRIIGHWSVVTGSTVMALEPVGLYHAGDPEFAAIDARGIAYMYQRGLDNSAAAMLAATTAAALLGDATVDSVLSAALAAASRAPLCTFDKRRFASEHAYLTACLEIADKYDDVLAARQELYEKVLFFNFIDPLELWGLALAFFKMARGDVRRAAIGGTNIGRDSDTIAGRAAMLAGALRGAGNVPAEWVKLFTPKSLERIDTNAAAFTRLLAGGKLQRHLIRQSVAQET